MPTTMVPEDHSEHVEIIAGCPVAIFSYRLGNTYIAKASIAMFGTGARIAMTEGETKTEAEEKVRAEARSRIENKNKG